MGFLNRFWRKLTKKDSVESAKYEKTVFLLVPVPVHAVFGIFFHGSGSGFSSDPDPDSGKSSIRIREKNRIRNTAFFADPNPAVVLNAEPDPDVIRIQL